MISPFLLELIKRVMQFILHGVPKKPKPVNLLTYLLTYLMKFSRAISRVKWLSREKTNVSKTISVLVLRVLAPLYHLTQLIARENFMIAFLPI